jgi:hypothetical protein
MEQKRFLFFIDAVTEHFKPKFVVNSSTEMGRYVPEKSNFSRKIKFFQKNPVFPEKSIFSGKIQFFPKNPVFPKKSSSSRKIQFFPEKSSFSRKKNSGFHVFFCGLGPGRMRWLNGLVGGRSPVAEGGGDG